jgi:actin-related protein 2
MNIAGRHVTDYFTKLLLQRGYAFNSSADFETVREIKESLCYVSYDLKKDRNLAQETTVVDKEYKLADGTSIIVGRERFEAPELLFTPNVQENESKGVSNIIFDSINESAIDCRASFYQNILLTGRKLRLRSLGGTTMYPGFPSRVEKDINDLYLHHILGGQKKEFKKFKIGIIVRILT